MSAPAVPRRGITRTVVVLVVAAMLLMLSGIVGLSGARAADCTPRAITADEVTGFDVSATNGTDEISAWEKVRASLDLTLEGGHCAGDSITVTLPAELNISSFPNGQITDADGEVVATTSIEGQEVTITLTDYVESRVDVTATAWWEMQINATIEPGTTQDLVWTVDGETVRTPIQVDECPGCGNPRPRPAKWGLLRADGSILIHLETPLATRDNQIIEFTDTLTNGGQQIRCSRAPWGQAFTGRNQGGDLENGSNRAVRMTSCTDTEISGQITLDEGEQGRVYFYVDVDDVTAGPWRDRATFVSGDQTWTTTAEVVRRSQGGSGDGSTTTTTTDEPTTDEPTTDEPTTDEPTTDEPTTDEPTTDEPTTDEPTTDEPTTDEPTSDEPTTDEPTTDEPTTDEPTTEGAPVPSSTSGSPVPEDGAAPAPGGPGAEAPTPSVVQTDGAGSGSRSLLPFAAAGMLLAAAGALALRPQAARRH